MEGRRMCEETGACLPDRKPAAWGRVRTLCRGCKDNGDEGDDATHDLHGCNHDGRSDEADSGVHNFQQGSGLGDLEPQSHVAVDLRGRHVPREGLFHDGLIEGSDRQDPHHGPAEAAGQVVLDQVQVFEIHPVRMTAIVNQNAGVSKREVWYHTISSND
jgi:hypothetical protein